MSKTAKILYFERTANDTADTASNVNAIVVPQRLAIEAARSIERFGELPAGSVPEFEVRGKPVQGHGVTIEYASGRRRTIRDWD